MPHGLGQETYGRSEKGKDPPCTRCGQLKGPCACAARPRLATSSLPEQMELKLEDKQWGDKHDEFQKGHRFRQLIYLLVAIVLFFLFLIGVGTDW